MQTRRQRNFPHRAILAGLVGLALLLLVAQMAAQWHGVTHLASVAASRPASDDQAPHDGHCDLCLGAAALGAGALPIAPLSFHLDALGHALPQTAAAPIWLASVSLAYQSRAPPYSPT
jgi:hypothetical protein